MSMDIRYRVICRSGLLFLFVCAFGIVQGQSNKAMYCKFLKRVTESADFQTTFSFCSDTNIVIIDTARNFSNCDSILVMGRKVQITNVKPDYIRIGMPGRDVMKARDRNYNAVLCLVREKHAKTDMYFWWPVKNVVVEFLLTVVKGNIVMESIYQGEGK